MNGPAFTYMVRTHRWLFVPGLGAAALGVAAAVGAESRTLAIALAGGSIAAALLYLLRRPALGVD